MEAGVSPSYFFLWNKINWPLPQKSGFDQFSRFMSIQWDRDELF
jgi:hypothetical protein